MIYLAIPYTGMPQLSYHVATTIAAHMTAAGEVVYSPITHSHPMTKIAGADIKQDWEFWERIDREFIKGCSELRVIELLGWELSKGVSAEIQIAKDLGIPISFISQGKIFDYCFGSPKSREA
jgi:hypothetical protein